MNSNTRKQNDISFRDKYNAFRDRHPKFRKYGDIISDFSDKFMIFYWIVVTAFVLLVLLILYYNLPTETRTEVAGLCGGVLSLIVIPLALNHINKRNENAFKLFEENKLLYYKISNILISLLTTTGSEFNKQREILNKLICENYYVMCISSTSSFIWDVIYIYKECEFENNNDNLKYYIQKCLREIRKHAGLSKDFYLNNKVLKVIAEQRK